MINRLAAAALALSVALAPASVPAQEAAPAPAPIPLAANPDLTQDLDNILFLDLSTGRRVSIG